MSGYLVGADESAAVVQRQADLEHRQMEGPPVGVLFDRAVRAGAVVVAVQPVEPAAVVAVVFVAVLVVGVVAADPPLAALGVASLD